MVTIGVACDADTKAPDVTDEMPTLPEIGARTMVRSMSKRLASCTALALLMDASACLTVALAASTFA